MFAVTRSGASAEHSTHLDALRAIGHHQNTVTIRYKAAQVQVLCDCEVAMATSIVPQRSHQL